MHQEGPARVVQHRPRSGYSSTVVAISRGAWCSGSRFYSCRAFPIHIRRSAVRRYSIFTLSSSLSCSAGDVTTFQPKLIFVVDARDGNPIDASLSPETRAYLQNLASKPGEIKPRTSPSSGGKTMPSNRTRTIHGDTLVTERAMASLGPAVTEEHLATARRVEVPLRSDSEFFRMLNLELSELNALQLREQVQLVEVITCLGKDISKVARPSQVFKRTDLYAWREIFSIYTDSKVFFSTDERDRFQRNSATAQKQLQAFSSKVQQLGLLKRLKKDSRIALDCFLQINLTLLRNLKFQELNGTAMTKILKSLACFLPVTCID